MLAWITDGYGWRWAVAIVAITAAAIIPVVLLLMRERPSDMGLAPYGLDWVATVPPTIALTNQTFGREQASVVFGWVFCAHMLGGAIAAWTAGTFREAFGDYLIAFTGAGLLALLAGFAALGIARNPASPKLRLEAG